MRLASNRWPNTEAARGTLFFAQLMRQMLSTSSYESFRAPSLDGMSRLLEARRVAGEVRERTIPRIALEPILEELAVSLGEDPAIRNICSREINTIKRDIANSKTTESSIIHRMNYILRMVIDDYKSTLESEIIDSFNDPRQRIRTRVGVSHYCSHLLNAGYSRSYLSEQVENIFFSRDISKSGEYLLKRFFAVTSGNIRSFTNFVSTNEPFGRHLKSSGAPMMVGSSLPAGVQSDLSSINLFHPDRIYLANQADALDEYNSALKTEQLLNILKSVAHMADQGMEFDWNTQIYVLPRRAKSGRFIRKEGLNHQRLSPTRLSNNRRLKDIRKYSTNLFTGFERYSASRLMTAIESCSTSLSSSNIENRLTSHWSAFEVLLSAPLPGNARISHYVDELAPCICLRYARSLSVALYDEMLLSYRRSFNDIVKRAITGEIADQHTAFVAVLLLDSNENLRTEMFSIASKDPLALHRLWKFATDFSDPTKAKLAVSNHERRIRWQLHRIYRARNTLVHAGAAPSYLDSLVLNLVEYFRTAVSTVVNRAERSTKSLDVDEVVSDLGVIYRSYLDSLEFNNSDRWSEGKLVSFFGTKW